jgi:hypothetical protein
VAPAPYPYPPPAGYPAPYPYYYAPPEAGPRYIMNWEPGRPVPPGYRQETRARKGLVIGGSATLGGLYLYSIVLADEESDNLNGQDYTWLWIPVLGPFVQMTKANDSNLPDSILFLDGIGQAGGLAMLITGLAFPRSVLVRNDIATMTVVPMTIGRGASGLGLVGRF